MLSWNKQGFFFSFMSSESYILQGVSDLGWGAAVLEPFLLNDEKKCSKWSQITNVIHRTEVCMNIQANQMKWKWFFAVKAFQYMKILIFMSLLECDLS